LYQGFSRKRSDFLTGKGTFSAKAAIGYWVKSGFLHQECLEDFMLKRKLEETKNLPASRFIQGS